MIHFAVPAAQAAAMKDYLAVQGKSLCEEFRALPYEDLAQQLEFARGTYVLAALDQLSPAMARLLFEIYKELKEIEGFRFLNDPSQSLQRLELLTELHNRGLNDFRAVRANSDLKDITFPVFLREERQHHGAISPLLNSVGEIHQAVGRALVEGHELRNLLIVEFCDTADEMGFYRKYAAFAVGKRVIPRSLNYGRHWMLKHSETEFTVPMVLEELDYVSKNPHQQQLLEIFELARVEYGRIDYAMKDGKLQTWEINLHPTIGRGLRPRSKNVPADVDAIRDEVRRIFYDGFESAWREVNLSTNGQPPVELRLSPQLIREAIAPVAHQQRLLNGIKTVLRPAKPLIEPLSPPFLSAAGWLARMFSGGQR